MSSPLNLGQGLPQSLALFGSLRQNGPMAEGGWQLVAEEWSVVPIRAVE
jgi:hypothetical protein